MIIPAHVVQPGDPAGFVPVAKHEFTNRAGLGYAILRALGANEHLSAEALSVVEAWSTNYGRSHGGVTPDSEERRNQEFMERVGTKWNADRAASNASCYPGGRGGRPSYAAIFSEVWREQKWPHLCRALSGGEASLRPAVVAATDEFSIIINVDRGAGPAPSRPWAMQTVGSGFPGGSAEQRGAGVTSFARGEPPQGDKNSVAAARMVVSRLAQLGFPWQDAIGADHVGRYGGRQAELEAAFRTHAADAAGVGPPGVPCLPLQVTRVPRDQEFWKTLALSGRTAEASQQVGDLVQELVAAADRKLGHGTRGVLLVLDARSAPKFFADGVLQELRARHGAELRSRGWAGVWIATATPQLCQRLDVPTRGHEREAILGVEAD